MEIQIHTQLNSLSHCFFNNGSQDGNKLIRQMLQVVLPCKFIVIKICGIVSDTGAGNIKIFKLLEGRHLVKKEPWPDAKCLSFANPVDKAGSIYM